MFTRFKYKITFIHYQKTLMKLNMKIEIYTTENCPYCRKAKLIFDSLSVDYNEIDVENEEQRQCMKSRAKGNYTVPQIFIGEDYIGGYDELKKLKDRGKLSKMLIE